MLMVVLSYDVLCSSIEYSETRKHDKRLVLPFSHVTHSYIACLLDQIICLSNEITSLQVNDVEYKIFTINIPTFPIVDCDCVAAHIREKVSSRFFK